MSAPPENTCLPAASKEDASIWPTPTLSSLTDSQVSLLTNYVQVPLDSVIPHILAIREKAWSIHPRPYIGQLRFLVLTLSESPSYSAILTHLKNDPNAKLLDLGCCFGQDIRKLIYDGAPASSIYGAELRSEFIELGFDCFRDRETIGATFLTANIFDPDSPLKGLEGKMNVVNIGLFLHQFDWNGQCKACERIVALLKPEKGVLVIGQQVGSLVQSDVVFRGGKNVTRQSEESFRRLWEEVGERTGSEWVVKARLDEGFGENVGEGTGAWDDADTRRLSFEVERVE
ncbi:hypothetical protein DL98DRAFT_601378 [Cadophora sp. DSE1049]|nr:hypothetical protein DL98DRAFT_601378 [Cadophora sp. DSE1049]